VTLLEKSEPFTSNLSVFIPILVIIGGAFAAAQKFGKKKGRKGPRKTESTQGTNSSAGWSVDELVHKPRPVVKKDKKSARRDQGKKSS
jgi:hypothetical protein